MADGRPDVLAAILGATRRIVEDRSARLPIREMERRASLVPDKRGVFSAALTFEPAPRVIAECKRRSPSRGVLRAAYDPASLAAQYAAAGAAAISVLTEPTFFDGDPAHLIAVRAAVPLPILRKDFIVDEYQLLEARAWGADAVLLIVAALDDLELRRLVTASAALGLETLVEVHTGSELDRALDAGARLVGVNNRNLRTLAVEPAVSLQLAARLRGDVIGVAASGLRSRGEVDALAAAGYRAVLVGERLMQADDPGAALAELLVEAGRSAR
jgi:indole-3-glycerol phosphate synthase